MTIHYTDDAVTLHHGDCLDVLRELPDNSVDSVVTDPPYAINFMGRKWDRFDTTPMTAACEECGNDDPAEGYRLCTDCLEKADEEDLRGAPMLGQQSQNWHAKATHSRGYADNNNIAFGRWCTLWAAECLRVLKPGGHLLAFGGTRTWHRLACAVEDAGFEIRDSIAWLYGSGFPKSLDVSKAIDRAAGATREVTGSRMGDVGIQGGNFANATLRGVIEQRDAPATDDARTWQGWGTALKPAFEPIVVGRKPLTGTVAANVLAHGTGALNIDGCRVGRDDGDRTEYGRDRHLPHANTTASLGTFAEVTPYEPHTAGRWPANVVLDHHAAAELDRQSGTLQGDRHRPGIEYGHGNNFGVGNDDKAGRGTWNRPPDAPGGASRFFPTFQGDDVTPAAQPEEVLTKALHQAAVEGRMPSSRDPLPMASIARAVVAAGWRPAEAAEPNFPTFRYEAKAPTAERPRPGEISHPTVKPLDLMRWLVRLVTPPGGLVLDPFAGSGTTAEACVIEGMRCIAIEREADYLPLIVARLSKPIQVDLFGGIA